MQLSEYYTWNIETVDGEIFCRGEKKWQDILPEKILRISLIPNIEKLQQIDVFCHKDDKFVGWFGKGFLKQRNDFQLTEYAQCIETETKRVWVLSDGRVLITHPEFNLRI